MSSKAALRKEMKILRDSLSQDDRIAKSRRVFAQLFTIPEFRNASTVAFYLSFGSEVITDPMIEWCLEHGKQVLVPKMKDDLFILVELSGFDGLRQNSYGVREPIHPAHATSKVPDIIIVPGLAFDASRHRLGYGKGHYDRFLKFQTCFKVGVAYSEQVIDLVPKEAHDIPLDAVITDSSVF